MRHNPLLHWSSRVLPGLQPFLNRTLEPSNARYVAITTKLLSEASNTLTARSLFTAATFLTTLILIGWGGFVTSIDAGLAVPDWPTTFNSWNAFDPFPGWWDVTSVRAEHGHRLLGALVGLLTLVLTAWVWAADKRRRARLLSLGLLILVGLQGLLGGLRVSLVSIDLAIVHACVAQLFVGALVLVYLTTRKPIEPLQSSGPTASWTLLLLPIAVYIQIILGALLRHPGRGIDNGLAGLHILGAIVCVVLVVLVVRHVFRLYPKGTTERKLGNVLAVLTTFQFVLGLTAYFVLLDEQGVLEPSNLQVVVNTGHLVLASCLWATSVGLSAVASRKPAFLFSAPDSQSQLDVAATYA